MANRLSIRTKNFAMPGNVEKIYATSVGGVTATLTHLLEKAKTTVHEESGLLEFELAAGTEGPAGVPLGSSTAEKYLLAVSEISQVTEY